MKVRRWNRAALLGASFFAPVFLFLVMMLAAGVYPFGNNSLMLWDIDTQYIPFLTYWREALTGGRDILYTFTRVLGSGTVDMAAYYLASPLNFVTLLFPDMLDAVTVLMILKIGLCGLTAGIYFRHTRSLGWGGVAFSTTYALMGFVAVYFYHVMWMDCLILLPLIVLGYQRLAGSKRPLLYIVSLALALWCQFYIAYMVCIFMVLYLVYDLLLNRRKIGRTILTFLASSVLAALLTAALLLPAFLALSQGPAEVSIGKLSLETVNTLRSIATKFYTASSSVVQQRAGGPNVYTGIPLLLLAVLFFANRAIPLKRRLVSLGFLGVFMLSFVFAWPYYAWHAFESPTYYPARFSFLFSFLLIDMAAQSAETLPAFAPKRLKRSLWIACGVFAALTGLLFHKLTIEYLSYKTIAMDVVFFLASAICLWLGFRRERRRRLCILALCGMQAVCLLLNCYYDYRRIGAVYTPDAETYETETARDEALVARVEDADDGLYRMEFDTHRIDNDPIAYGYNGLSHDSSVFDAGTYAFARALGMRESDYHIKYRSGLTPMLEGLLGLKYILRTDGNALEALPEGYEELWRDGDTVCYENTYAMPFACLAPEQTLTLDDSDPFVNQNRLLSDLLGEDVTVFTPLYDIGRTYDGTWETYTFTAQANRMLYMKSAGAQYRINGGDAEDGIRYQTMILLPIADTDTDYEISLTAPLGLQLAYFDLDTFQQAIASLQPYGVDVESDTDSHLTMRVSVPEGRTQLVLTVAYDDGWQAWVDGEPAETACRYGALLAVNLTPGTHTVELRYTPVGLTAGIVISLCALAVLVLLCLLWRRKKGAGKA